MDKETSFLRNIRTALGESPRSNRSKSMYPGLFASPAPEAALADQARRSTAEQDRLVDILCEYGKTLNISSHVVQTIDQAAAVVVELIRTSEPEFSHTKHVILHDHPDVAALQLWNRFSREAVTLHTSFASDQQLREKTVASFIGITAPDIAVADSATLVQLTRPGQPRSTSLLPSIHIALVRKKNLVANLSEAYALLRQQGWLDSVVFISGPSKTADIEAQLVHGAHGPRAVHLIVLAESTDAPAIDSANETAGSGE